MYSQKSIEILNTPINLHGEGPIWHQGRQSIMWVDILSDQILEYSWDRQELSVFSNAKLVSAIFEIENQHNLLVVIVQGGIAIYNLNHESYQIINDLRMNWDNIRGNDGGVDPDGSIWFSTTHMDHLEGRGDLFRLQSNGELDRILSKISISNGPCWSVNSQVIYHTDSATSIIKGYTWVDQALIEVHPQIEIPDGFGFPDGMAMDLAGILCGFDSHTGKLIRKIILPVPQVSSCAFVGPNLENLFITSSRKGMSEMELEKYPESGRSFLIGMETSGGMMKTFNKKF